MWYKTVPTPLWRENSYLELLPSVLQYDNPAHNQSGHLVQNLSLRFLPQVPALLLFLGHFWKLPKLCLQKVSDLCPKHLQSNRRLILCDLLPASDLGQRAALSSAHLPTPNPLGVNVWKLCLQSKRPQGFYFHKVGALVLRELPANLYGQLVPPHAAGCNLHSLNLIHQLQIPQQTHHHLSILTNRKKTRNQFLPVMILFCVFHIRPTNIYFLDF